MTIHGYDVIGVLKESLHSLRLVFFTASRFSPSISSLHHQTSKMGIVRTYDEELSYIEKLSNTSWLIKKGFVPNMKVG